MRLAHRHMGPKLLTWLRAEVTGRAFVPTSGGVLLAANHRSFLDHYLLAAASPRPMRFLGKVELAEGFFGRFNQAMGMVPVERGHADLGALDRLADVLRSGDVVGVFPEGTRSPSGELFRFRSGMARIAALAQCPVVPAGLLGTGSVWPRHHRPRASRPPEGTVIVRFGHPLAPPGADARLRRAFTEEVYRQVSKLCDQRLADGFAPIPEQAS